jgi:hypothetical protein
MNQRHSNINRRCIPPLRVSTGLLARLAKLTASNKLLPVDDAARYLNRKFGQRN